MASFFSGGKASDDKDKLAKHNAILAAHGHAGYGPSGGASPSSKKKSGGGGKGSGEPAKPKYDPKSKDFADVLKKHNEDGKFGYGYVDANTGIEVPWYIDMINGGGANAAGPEFVSPFEDAPMGGGMAGIASQGVTGIANALPFVTPYGSEQARPYAQAGMVGYDHLGDQSKPKPSAGGSSAVTSDAGVPPVNPYAVGGGFDVTAPAYTPTPKTSDEAIGGYQYPTMYRPMDRQVGLFNQGQASVAPMLPAGADAGRAELARLNRNRQAAMASFDTQGPDIDPAMYGNDVNTSIIVNQKSRLDLAKTVPYKWLNTSYDKMYQNFLAKGGTAPFEAWLKGDR